MFEITPKEQLLKNVRKGLVQPLVNNYPLLNFDKQLVEVSLQPEDEDFVKSWVNKGFYFSTFSGIHDLAIQLISLTDHYQLGLPFIEDPLLKTVYSESGLRLQEWEQDVRTIFTGFSRLETLTETIYFSSEIHPVRLMKQCENIILFGKSSYIVNPQSNKYYTEQAIRKDFKVQIPIDYFKKFQKAFLLLESE